MTFFCIRFIVLYLLSHVKIVVCIICMYSILNKILFTLSSFSHLGQKLLKLNILRFLLETIKPGCVASHNFGTVSLCLQNIGKSVSKTYGKHIS